MPVIVGDHISQAGTGLSTSFGPIRPPAYDNAEAELRGNLTLVGAGDATEGVPPPLATGIGRRVDTSFDDWYYRIHFYPSQFNLGNLAGRQVRTLTMWNALFEPVDLTAFDLVNGEGINVTEPVTPPSTVLALRVLRYVVEISTDGPPVINAVATFTVDGQNYDIPINGRRIVLFPFPPNWSSPVEETLEDLTAVETSYTGREQVSGLRAEPRRIMQYNVRLHGDDVNLFDSLVYGWVGRFFAVPLWPEKSELTADVSTGATVLPLPTVGRTFAPGTLAVLFLSTTIYEIVEVATVTATSVTLVRPTERSWLASTVVYPLMISASDPNVSTSRQSDTHLDSVLRFTSSPVDNFPRAAAPAPSQTYRGEELYTGETNWISALNVEMMARETRQDGDSTGVFRLTRRAPFPLLQRGFRWMAKTREEAETIRQLLARRRGRRVPFWVPSGQRDFILALPATSAQPTLFVRNTEYGSLVQMHPSRRDIVIQLRDGTFICRRILAYSIDAQGRGALTLDNSAGVDLNSQNVKRISFLGRYRLSSDEVTLTWMTDGLAVVETNLTLKEATS